MNEQTSNNNNVKGKRKIEETVAEQEQDIEKRQTEIREAKTDAKLKKEESESVFPYDFQKQ